MPRYDFLCQSCKKQFSKTLTLPNTKRIRRKVSGEAIWSADAIHSIMALYTNTEAARVIKQ